MWSAPAPRHGAPYHAVLSLMFYLTHPPFHESLAAGDYREFRVLFDEDASVVWRGGVPQPVDGFWEDLEAWRTRAAVSRVDTRQIRLQVNHSGNAGTAWLTSVWTVARSDDDTKDLEHRAVFLLHRRSGRWQVVSLLLQQLSTQSSQSS